MGQTSPENPAQTPTPPTPPPPARRRAVLRLLLAVVVWTVLLTATLWAAAAISFDLPAPSLRTPLALVFLLVILGAAVRTRFRQRGAAVAAVGFFGVLAWWLTIAPSNDRAWQPDVAVLPWATFDGDRVTVHNVRTCVYRSETDYDVHHQDRTYDLNRLTSLDLFLVHWGSPLIAHTMLSFGFDDGQHLCFSIEARKEKGESYSALRGFFRQYELTYIVADERDLVWLRTGVRTGEDVRLYRLHPLPQVPRKLLVNYLETATRLHDRPRWYNAASDNCTTNILVMADQARGFSVPLDWRMLFNGRIDELLFERGGITGPGTFEEIRAAALINPKTAAIQPDADYSRAIREGRPGF